MPIGGGGPRAWTTWTRDKAQIDAAKANARLVKEAEASRGGTPLHRAWRRLRRAVGTEDPPSGD